MDTESERRRKDASRYLERAEQWFWQHVEYQMAQTGATEQEVLDSIKTPGYTGRKARQAGSGNDGMAEPGRGEGRSKSSAKTLPRPCG